MIIVKIYGYLLDESNDFWERGATYNWVLYRDDDDDEALSCLIMVLMITKKRWAS